MLSAFMIACMLVGLALPFQQVLETNPPTTIQQVIEEGYTPLIFARVSSKGQSESLPQQTETIKRWLIARGFTKTPFLEFAIQQSGFKGEQQNIKIVRKLVKLNPKKRYVAVFREMTRIGRDTEIALRMRRELSEMAVPIIALDLPELTGKKPVGTRSVDVLYGILSTVAETGKETELIAKEQSAKISAEKGVLEGGILALYPERYSAKHGSAYRQLWEGSKAVAAGVLSNKQLSRNLGFVSKSGKDKGKANTSQPRKILGVLQGIEKLGKLDEYLDVVDEISRIEASNIRYRRDRKPANLRGPTAKALHRVTVAYLRQPDKWPNPITEGNPDIATILGKVGVGTVEDALRNPQKYLGKPD